MTVVRHEEWSSHHPLGLDGHRLHHWLADGAGDPTTYRPEAPSGEVFDEVMATGAVIAGRQQLVRVLGIYVEHYNRRRPHRSLGLGSPIPSVSGDTASTPAPGQLRRRNVLGGLIHEYEWAA